MIPEFSIRSDYRKSGWNQAWCLTLKLVIRAVIQLVKPHPFTTVCLSACVTRCLACTTCLYHSYVYLKCIESFFFKVTCRENISWHLLTCAEHFSQHSHLLNRCLFSAYERSCSILGTRQEENRQKILALELDFLYFNHDSLVNYHKNSCYCVYFPDVKTEAEMVISFIGSDN